LRFQPVFLFFSFGNDCFQYWLDACTFILKKGFEGIIEAGTPVCQLNIIKNESWKTEVKKYDAQRVYKNSKLFWKTFVGSYKKNFWKRHSYE